MCGAFNSRGNIKGWDTYGIDHRIKGGGEKEAKAFTGMYSPRSPFQTPAAVRNKD
jgi:hypothetical protein